MSEWDAVQRRIGQILERSHVPGVGVAYVDASGASWSGGIGWADAAAKRAVTGDTFFRVGSISKSVTALALVQLAERGAVSLSAHLRDLAPDVELDNRWEAAQPLTVEHLLEHTSGFDESRVNEDYDFGATPRPLREVVKINPRSRRARWPPGTRMSYSNENYLVAGYVIERITGRTFEDVIAEQIFGPLGMTGSAFSLTPRIRETMAQGYRGRRRTVPAPNDEMLIRPAVSMLSTPREMLAYLTLWLRRGPGLVGQQWMERIERTGTLPYDGPAQRYGLGNDLEQYDGHLGRGHGGLTDGFTASFRYFPQESVGWVLLFNHQSPGSVRSAVEREMLRFLIPKPARLPAPVEVAAQELRRWAGYYRRLTPQYQLFAATTELVDGVRLSAQDGVLVERSFPAKKTRWRALVGGSQPAFCREGESISSRLLVVTAQGKRALITPTAYFEESSWALALLWRALIFGSLAVLAAAIPVAVVHLIQPEPVEGPSTPLGANGAGHLLLLTAAISLFSLPVLLIRTPHRWGQRNASTLAACALTWVFGLASVAALIYARGQAMVPAIAAVALTVWLWRASWLGIRLWRF